MLKYPGSSIINKADRLGILGICPSGQFLAQVSCLLTYNVTAQSCRILAFHRQTWQNWGSKLIADVGCKGPCLMVRYTLRLSSTKGPLALSGRRSSDVAGTTCPAPYDVVFMDPCQA